MAGFYRNSNEHSGYTKVGNFGVAGQLSTNKERPCAMELTGKLVKQGEI
jgi:hypothetical protein